jgi:hypothetical protein
MWKPSEESTSVRSKIVRNIKYLLSDENRFLFNLIIEILLYKLKEHGWEEMMRGRRSGIKEG